MTGRTKLILAVATIVLLGGAGGFVAMRKQKAQDPKDVATVEKGPIEVVLAETGRIEAMTQVEIKSKVAGQVARFAVRGGFLKVGGSKVTILVDSAVAEADADTAKAKQELDETLATLQHPKTDEEFTELLDRRAWCESRIKLGSS